MSRRHHGRTHQGGRYRHEPPRPAPGKAQTAQPGAVDGSSAAPDAIEQEPAEARTTTLGPGPESIAALPVASGFQEPASLAGGPPPSSADRNGHGAAPHGNGHANGHPLAHRNGQDRANGCTAPQLRRFIKSRPYVPMHELRRRFAIDGGDDDVTQVLMASGNLYVGLPQREGSLLGELLRGGEIGYELSMDPRTPVVVGVYPMRPVPRS